MTRPKAVGMTILIVATGWALGYAVERWPNTTIAGATLAAIYSKLREPREATADAQQG